MNKLRSARDAIGQIKDGASVMWGGFFHGGRPQTLLKALLESGVKNLTAVSLDSGMQSCPGYALLGTDQVVAYTASHVGRNPHITRRANAGELKLTLMPMGNLIESIRAAGFGLGGYLTPTGVGTLVEEGKQIIEVNGKKYLLELPISADFALIKATRADEAGNLYLHGTTRNYNLCMAFAGRRVIAEADEIVPVGEIDPDMVHVPGVVVDDLVLSEVHCHG